jgi:hypothetical protein
MTLRRSSPIAWRPLGVTDAIDGSMAREGSMAQLANLIPDPSTLGVFICRPASTLLLDFNATGTGAFSSGFSTGFQTSYFTNAAAGNITCLRVFGGRVYGMISGPSGFDYPFVFDLVKNILLPVTNALDITKLPNTVNATGPWVPPTIAQVGVKVLVTHPGFTGSGPTNLFFGQFDISNPNAITWTAGNMNGGSAIVFATPPNAVENFNGRAYWALNAAVGTPVVVFSDVLVPTNVTSASQVLTFDDQQPITALAPLPLNNQLGGIIQAIMVFKGSAQVYQVTGDAALSTLAKNALNIATGTNSPLSIAVTPKGIGFISPDGFRLIDFNAQISDPIGWDGGGKTVPFIFSGEPSRVVGASTGTMYRVAVKDPTLLNAPFVEYWFDVVRGQWSGPHTFPPQAIDAWNNTFITSSIGVPGKLWRSDPFITTFSSFVENGTQMTWSYVTTMLPDTDLMCELAMIETTITMGMDLNVNYPASFLDQNGQQLGSAAIFFPSAAALPLWGSAVWGAFQWGASPTSLFPRQVAWSAPVVFRRGQFAINGNSGSNVRLGTLHCRYEQLGYLQQGIAA